MNVTNLDEVRNFFKDYQNADRMPSELVNLALREGGYSREGVTLSTISACDLPFQVLSANLRRSIPNTRTTLPVVDLGNGKYIPFNTEGKRIGNGVYSLSDCAYREQGPQTD